MYYFIALLILPFLTYFYAYFSNQKKEKKQLAFLNKAFGKEAFSPSSSPKEASKLWQYQNTSSPHPYHVDDTTWQDLSLDEVFISINNCHSSLGEELLYATLHQNQSPSPQERENFESFQQFLLQNPSLRSALQMHLHRLGKSPQSSLVYLFEYQESFLSYKPKWVSFFAYLPFFSLPLVFFSPLAALVWAAISGGFNLYTFISFHKTHSFQRLIIAYLSHFIYAAKNIFSLLPKESLPQGEKLHEQFSLFQNVSAHFSRSSEANVQSDSELMFISRFFQALFLRQILSYNKGVSVFQKHQGGLFSLYQAIGKIDMAISIAAYRKSLPYYCLPQYHSALSLSTQEVYHPFLPKGVRNSFSTEHPILLTGSNASGKSTFLKTLALNSILAHSLHTCLAKEFVLPNCPVYTSMAIKDSIFKGESYFIAEIKSIKRIANLLAATPCLCFIDEILRGTNTVERISASTALLELFSTFPGIVMVATHDLELTEILQGIYHFYHFREHIGKDDIHFDYKIYPGPSQTKNAIALLGLLGFNKQIINKAYDFAQFFEENHYWPSL